jgi:aminoglycoside phosphotransferase (APT) family kinase protein
VGSDPFAALVSRALGTQVHDVAVERLAETEESGRAETDRLRWRGSDGDGVLLFRRFPVAASLEVGLLPYLARRGAPVPRVVASGVPPRHVREPRPWILIEAGATPTLCEVHDPSAARRAAEAIFALQHAVAPDLATLRSLRVPELPASRIREESRWAEELLAPQDFARLEQVLARLDAAGLEALGTTLVHGALSCTNVLLADGARFVRWSRAHLGCPLHDVARLAADLRERDPEMARATLQDAPAAEVRQADLLHWLSSIRWHAWESREALRARPQCAELVRGALARAEAV